MCASPYVFTLQTYFCVRCDNIFLRYWVSDAYRYMRYYTHVHDSRSLSFPIVPLPPLPPIRVMLGYVHEKLGFCCPLSISADFRVSQQTESDPSDHWLIPPNFSVTAETVSKMRPDPTNKVKWFISSQWTRECLRPSFMHGVQSEIITYLKGIKHTKTFIWYAKTNQTLVFYCIYIHR